MNTKCPYCESTNTTFAATKSPIGAMSLKYKCKDCERYFDSDDIVREDLRHKMSAILMDCNDEHKMLLDSIVIGHNEAQGLSELEMPCIIGAFQDREGIIWFDIEGANEPIEFDAIDTDDLKTILIAMNKPFLSVEDAHDMIIDRLNDENLREHIYEMLHNLFMKHVADMNSQYKVQAPCDDSAWYDDIREIYICDVMDCLFPDEDEVYYNLPLVNAQAYMDWEGFDDHAYPSEDGGYFVEKVWMDKNLGKYQDEI